MTDSGRERAGSADETVAGVGARHLAVTAIAGLAVAVVVARTIDPSTYATVVGGLAGASAGSLVPYLYAARSGASGTMAERGRPWFHRGGAGLALGLATLTLLAWGTLFESLRAGYAAAFAVGTMGYALLASIVPRR
ncbi:hypothetical protein [Halovivax sp.]|uniref:hypothetical protein n=1 Tax=Halovivax sp. TaxID=1935978 RepID=UPI0025B84825|nr:hypothetical protein [Halovivax sp.]